MPELMFLCGHSARSRFSFPFQVGGVNNFFSSGRRLLYFGMDP